MFLQDYFAGVGNAIEFLMALGSIIGLLGIVIAFLGMLLMGSRARRNFISMLLVSCLLVGVCGLYTGIKYFRIHV